MNPVPEKSITNVPVRLGGKLALLGSKVNTVLGVVKEPEPVYITLEGKPEPVPIPVIGYPLSPPAGTGNVNITVPLGRTSISGQYSDCGSDICAFRVVKPAKHIKLNAKRDLVNPVNLLAISIRFFTIKVQSNRKSIKEITFH